MSISCDLNRKGELIISGVHFLSSYLLKINIFGQFHIFGVNTKDFITASGVRDADINFAIKAAKSPECGVNGVRSVRSGHDDNIGMRFDRIHKSE
jgi:hypothetical protein